MSVPRSISSTDKDNKQVTFILVYYTGISSVLKDKPSEKEYL